MTRFSIPLGGRPVDVIDLTHPTRPGGHVFPGDPPIERVVTSRVQETGFEYYVHHLGDHVCCPHADAPKHQNPDLADVGVEAWGPETEFNRATLIDLEPSDDAIVVDGIRFLPTITLDHLTPHREAIAAVGAVVVRTGIEAWRVADRPFTADLIPGFTADAGAFLASFDGLRVVATDSLTVDIVRPEAPVHTVHQALKYKLIVESLVHLAEIPVKRHRDFLLQTALLRIDGATGCPVIARAYLD